MVPTRKKSLLQSMESTPPLRPYIKRYIMKEDFLHYVWKTRRFDLAKLETTAGQKIEIISFGTHNHDAGPDFLNGRLRIGGVEWAGNIEMHLRASEWYVHRHDLDRAYDNVVLHVVLEEDAPVTRRDGTRIPCLVLRSRIPAGLQGSYLELLHSADQIACLPQIGLVPEHVKAMWLDRLLIERLEAKTEVILQELVRNDQDWNAVCYKYIGRCFGLSVNTDAFEMLCHSLDWKILRKHKDQLFQMEALLFGQAGMLDREFVDVYPTRLQKEYAFLRSKYQLAAIPMRAWKFMRMRPANLPSVRIAQFAFFLFKTEFLFSKLLAAQSSKELHAVFELSLHNYWKTHYVFDKESKANQKSLGKSMVDLIIVNGVVPLLFAYGISVGDEDFKDKALGLLQGMRAEQNKITRFWKGVGMDAVTAADSQSLIQLRKRYCDERRCLACGIGNFLLRKKKSVV